MTRLIIYAAFGAVAGAAAFYLLAGNLPEGGFAGGMIGLSLGILVAMRRGASASGPAFEFEAAGIHDNNLTTTARRNLVREAYRDSVNPQVFEEKIEGLGSAGRPKRR